MNGSYSQGLVISWGHAFIIAIAAGLVSAAIGFISDQLDTDNAHLEP